MDGVVSLLDKKNDRIVSSLWEELERAFHVHGVYRTPYPHFTYQIASDYDFSKLEVKLQKFAKESKRFTVHACGLGIFTGRKPVYIPVVRSIDLSLFHRSLWQRILSTGSGVSPLYGPDSWTPHITLAQWDIDLQNLPRIVRRLSTRKLGLDIKVNNVAIFIDDGTTQTVRSKLPFL